MRVGRLRGVRGQGAEEKEEERRRREKKKRRKKGKKERKRKEKERERSAGFAATVGSMRRLRRNVTHAERGEQRDETVIGAGVGTADRREEISGD